MFRFPAFLLFVLAAGLVGAPFGAGHAATQSLALLETDEATPLICADGVCKAEFSTFCLQKERALPSRGDPYQAADGASITLVLTAPDGTERRISATEYVSFAAARGGHTAVTIALPEQALASLGAQKAAIEVGARTALMPVPYAGDDSPQTAQDKALAAGPLRELGQRIVDRGPHDTERVHVLNRLINALPEHIDRAPNAQQSLWRKATETGLQSTHPVQMVKAAQEYGTCWQDRLVQMGGYSVRYCLQRRHDKLMWEHVNRYWDAVG